MNTENKPILTQTPNDQSFNTPNQQPENPTPQKKKSHEGIIIGGIVVVVLALIVILLLVVIPSVQEAKRINDSQEMIMLDNYYEAIQILTQNPSASSPKVESLLKKAYEEYSEEILEIMDKGDYVKAFEMVNTCAQLPNYEKLTNQIEFESYILACAQIIKSSMYDSDSLKINKTEFFIYTNTDNNSQTLYLLLSYSGKTRNGYTNIAHKFLQYKSDENEWDSWGAVYDLDPNECDDEDEKLLAMIIQVITESSEKYNALYDANRINRILANNISYKIDSKLFSREYLQNSVENSGV